MTPSPSLAFQRSLWMPPYVKLGGRSEKKTFLPSWTQINIRRPPTTHIYFLLIYVNMEKLKSGSDNYPPLEIKAMYGEFLALEKGVNYDQQ